MSAHCDFGVQQGDRFLEEHVKTLVDRKTKEQTCQRETSEKEFFGTSLFTFLFEPKQQRNVSCSNGDLTREHSC